MPRTTAVEFKVSEVEIDKLLGCDPATQPLRATAFDNFLTSYEFVVAFTLQTGECIGLLGVTSGDFTLNSSGDPDRSAGCDEQGVAAVVRAEKPIRGDA
jgi:hypothetical protein